MTVLAEEKELVNIAKVIGITEFEYKLDDNTSLARTKDIPRLRIGDIVEISTDGTTVIWNFVRR